VTVDISLVIRAVELIRRRPYIEEYDGASGPSRTKGHSQRAEPFEVLGAWHGQSCCSKTRYFLPSALLKKKKSPQLPILTVTMP
jgi:hypothetical protein